MIEVKVCRDGSSPNNCATNDPLLHWGADISDPLLSTEEAAKERGRVEIEKSYTNRKLISLDILNLDFNQPNQLSELIDLFSNQKGLLISSSISISKSGKGLSAKSTANIEVAA